MYESKSQLKLLPAEPFSTQLTLRSSNPVPAQSCLWPSLNTARFHRTSVSLVFPKSAFETIFASPFLLESCVGPHKHCLKRAECWPSISSSNIDLLAERTALNVFTSPRVSFDRPLTPHYPFMAGLDPFGLQNQVCPFRDILY